MKNLIVAIIAVFSVSVLSGTVAVPAYAACTDASSCVSQGITDAGGPSTPKKPGPIIKNIVNVLLYVLGALSVIMIIMGGIRYTTSNGDASRIKAAKDTIMYAVIGLVVALLSSAIISLVNTYFSEIK